MKFWKKYRTSFLVLVLTIFLIGGVVPISGVLAEEDTGVEASTEKTMQTAAEASTEKVEETEKKEIPAQEGTSKEETNQEETKKSDTKEETTQAEEDSTEKTEDTTTQEDKNEIDTPVAQSDEGIQLQANTDAKQIFNMEVTFDGQTLNADSENNAAFGWEDTNAKSMAIKLTKNNAVALDSQKNYVVCIKVPEEFYFSGLPDAKDINGVEEVTIVKNECLQCYSVSGQDKGNLPGFSPYSGEIRLRLNPAVDIITIPNIGVNYNKELIGYTGGVQSVPNPADISLISVDNTKNLKDFMDSDKEIISDYQVKSISIKTASLSGSGLKNSLSTDGFNNSNVNEQDVYIGKNDDTISYAGGTAGQINQYYKTLTVEFSCPYITVDGKKYYLDFDKQDTAFSKNMQGKKWGYHMSQDAVYNADTHTITYSFKDIYIGGHTVLFYTPKFSWPVDEAIKDMTIASDTNYKVEGADWSIKEQTCYTGVKSSLREKFTPQRYAYYYPDDVNITLTSSDQAEPKEQIAKRKIYKEITRKNAVPGALGFFDIHNKGTADSPEINVSFEFNTEKSDKATYYITQVNLPVYGNENGVDVIYELTNGSETKSGTMHYNTNGSFGCYATTLRGNSGVGSDYYIKSISYKTQLKRGTAYHMETAHLWRNRTSDSGLYFGYLEGDVDASAHAKMTIEAVDQSQSINLKKEPMISSTEKSSISNDNYMAYSLSAMKINNGSSTAITAGNSFTLQFGANISNEEYSNSMNTGERFVNGYHIFENGVFYLCLPDGISISGTDQVKVQRKSDSDSVDIPVQSVKKVKECTVNNQKAYWWEIQADNIKQSGGKQFTVDIQLATDLKMNSLSWSFQNCVAVRAKGQYISWGAAGSNNNIYNTTDALDKNSKAASLSAYLREQQDTTNLGLSVYNENVNTKLTIARAEAKLDVETGIKIDSQSKDQTAVSIDNVDKELTYDVTAFSKDGGYAKEFSYYIPIVSKDSAIDKNTFVARKDFGIQLQRKINISNENTGSTENVPFDVYYTKEKNLTGSNIRSENVQWIDAQSILESDLATVTAVKIKTKENSFINNGDAYKFSLTLKYDGSETDFNSDAGSVIEWRSFGYYTYVRNESSTSAIYPSGINRVKICYKKDLRQNPMNVELKTDAASNVASNELKLSEKFKNEQNFIVKKVEASGVQLIKSDPKDLTGTKANTQFNVTFNINNMTGTAAQLTNTGTDAGKEWKVSANGEVALQSEVKFSQALTDQVTPRYVDVTIGNDDIDIIFRIQLQRFVKAATAKGSGVTNGANYQVPSVYDKCSIAQQSAFTALYVLDFVPGNYENQVITWKDNAGQNVSFPAKTKITMMEISVANGTEASTVNSFWHYKTTGTETSINLNQFKRMSGSDTYTYGTSATVSQKVNYMFVVDFSEAQTATGTYNFAWEAVPKESGNEWLSYKYPVTLINEKSYELTSSTKDGLIPEMTIHYNVTETTNDSYVAHRSLALVLKPSSSSKLPEDANMECAGKQYTRNSDGTYIIPIENISSGEKTISFISNMFPDEEIVYSFEAQLYLADSIENTSPMNGIKVGSAVTINLRKLVQNKPALCITGKRIGTVSDWIQGQDISIQLENIVDGHITVTAYMGTSGTQKVTDLLSSVSGKFEITDGTGVYKKGNTDTGLLKLSSNAQPGTYRLVFDVMDDANQSIMQVPYYIIIK